MADDNNLPAVIIHRLSDFQHPLPWPKHTIFNPIESSDPLYPVHRASARVLIVIPPSPLKAEHLDQYPSVECVVGTSAGVDHIDLADYAIGLLLDVLRRVSAAHRFVRAGLWPVKDHFPLGNKAICLVEMDMIGLFRWWHDDITVLGEKRVGIVGLGNIGTLVAKRLEPFGCTIAYTSRNKKPQIPYAYYPTVLDLATNSDSLIICCALSNKTRHIINRDVLTALGKKGVIVNIGRGALVDEKELVKFLVEGELGGAGLDVFENEPEVPKELYMLDNVVLSPHRAVATPESFNNVMEVVIANITAFFLNKPLLSEIDLNDWC
ncbi:glyoxylate/hydroxypyruvate reductase HPR3 isoform X2 [Helianthus annuus]|uniref:glyoxylate/hydroxypyruvate reductase HPR3 isoform X2 n=1 Tax=Helianthus annuus TaxID=4232 RepID=UPI0016533C71|nr:glyoxylate/hydroxypyruvate reductase HPR3 isoform X2 [Helianthus annuus]